MRNRLRAATLAGFVALGGGLSAVQAAAAPPATAPIAIEHVTILTMAPGAAPIPDGVILIDKGRIVAAGAAAGVTVPKAARRIAGRGLWAMPGLTDFHVHIPNDGHVRTPSGAVARQGSVSTQDALTPFLANGVLQVFNLAAIPESIGQSREVETGAVLGPHILNAAMIDGSPPVWTGMARVAATPSDGRQAVRDVKFEGYGYVKVYSRLDMPTYAAIVDEANRQGMKVLGHIPNAARGHTGDAFVPGYGVVAHAEEFAKQSPNLSDADIASFVAMSKANGTWFSPTLVATTWIARQTHGLDELKVQPALKYLHPAIVDGWLHDNRYVKSATPERVARHDQMVLWNARLTKAMAAAGVPILAGTDSMIPGVAPGFALHEELELLAKAGLSNAEVLVSATRAPAEWLGVAADRGVIAAGKQADLLLLSADPLADVGNTRKIAAVVVNGRYVPRAKLDAMMADLARRNSRAPPTAMPAVGGIDDDDDQEATP